MFERLAERIIREAVSEGRFDNLPGAGRPIDLEDYFRVPEDRRMAYGLLKSANMVPEEVELLKEIDRLETVRAAAGNTVPQALVRRLEDLRLQLSERLDSRRRSRRRAV